MATHRSVTVVFDADFGSELERLAGRMPVWVVDTPANRTVAERLWQHPKLDITTFQARPGDTVEETCVSLLGTVELHHGPLSADPACAVWEVIGATASEDIRKAWADIGFVVAIETPSGFRAERAIPG